MMKKQKGACPFCSQSVEPTVVEENTLRRDKLRCPECGETVFLCRSPGCHHFAKGTTVYDHELCPSCTEAAGNVAGEIGKTVLKIGGAVATALATAVVLGKAKK